MSDARLFRLFQRRRFHHRNGGQINHLLYRCPVLKQVRGQPCSHQNGADGKGLRSASKDLLAIEMIPVLVELSFEMIEMISTRVGVIFEGGIKLV
jgi:hypothetical protein